MDRDAFLAEHLAATPSWYSPYLHLAATVGFGLAIIVVAVFFIDGLRPIELLTVPIVYVFSNASEWRAHRDLLHKRSPIAPILYDRHTPIHHRIYTAERLAVVDPREWRLVLIPSWGIMLIFLATGPITLALWLGGHHNIAALFAITTMAYVASYEVLHLAYHLPRDSAIGGLAIIDRLRRHHAIHHDPANMQRYNFNVTVPLWDVVRRTMAPRAPERKVAPAPIPSASSDTSP